MSYSAILPLELHCSTFANFFAIVAFYKSKCWGFLGFNAKSVIHLAFDNLDVNALIASPQAKVVTGSPSLAKKKVYINLPKKIYMLNNIS